jgi:TonB-dependent SusC/RagA subfamily outer membrane receptor
MSLFFFASRAPGALACIVAFAAAAGCHHASSNIESEPSPAERPKGGYGEQLSELSGGAIQSVAAEQLNHRAVGQVGELLEARFPGVGVIRTASGGFLIRVRGVSSFLGSSEPLYVIDGIPVPVDPQHGLDWLSPNDIQGITVLKGPPHTTLYGVRGANGVILITTRR